MRLLSLCLFAHRRRSLDALFTKAGSWTPTIRHFTGSMVVDIRISVRDWLYGVRNAEPEPADSVEAQTESERLRIINHMITLSPEEGGAGITPNIGEWKNVVSIFPLHDVEANRRSMSEWSKKTFLSDEDLERIRNTFGESVCSQPIILLGMGYG